MNAHLTLLALFIFGCLFGCEATISDGSDCSNGRVIGPQLCTEDGDEGFYLIQLLDSDSSGTTITYYDGQVYQNVVEVTNLADQYKKEQMLIKFHYKIQDQKELTVCTTMFFVFDVPQITVDSICHVID